RDHELDRLAPAHRARRGLDRERVEAAAREDAAIGLEVALEGRVEAGGVEVERVGVLHHELAHAQEARLRARLVAELRLELVPDLRQVAIAADLGRDLREDLLVRHAERVLRALAVLEAEHLLAHHLPASRALPELRRVERGERALLAADRVHLAPHDARDLRADAHAERQQRVDARGELSHVARAHEEAMAHRLRVRRVFAQGRDEGSGPAHACSLAGVRAARPRARARYRASTPRRTHASSKAASSFGSRGPGAPPPTGLPSSERTPTRPAPLPVRKHSSAAKRSKRPRLRSRAGIPSAGASSSTVARVMPSSAPSVAGGVQSSPPRTTKTFATAASATSPAAFSSSASSAPRERASSLAWTLFR